MEVEQMEEMREGNLERGWEEGEEGEITRGAVTGEDEGTGGARGGGRGLEDWNCWQVSFGGGEWVSKGV